MNYVIINNNLLPLLLKKSSVVIKSKSAMKSMKIFFFLLLVLSCQYLTGQCPGNSPLAFTFESTEASCDSSGTITVHITGGVPFIDPSGNPVYNNTIIAPIVMPAGGQADSVFMNLPADTYTIEVMDSCGTIVTQMVTVSASSYSSNLSLSAYPLPINCDTGCVVFNVSESPGSSPWGEYPYQWEVINSSIPGLIGLTGQFDTLNEVDSLCFSPHFVGFNAATLEVTDACGKVSNRTLGFSTFSLNIEERFGICDRTSEIIIDGPTAHCEAGTVTYEIFSAPAGFPIPPPKDTGYWAGLIPGQYCFRATDCCGNIWQSCRAIDAINWGLRIDTTDIQTCDPDQIGFFTWPAYYPAPPSGLMTILTSAPAGYSNPLPDTFPLLVNDIVGPPGNYCVMMVDSCGRKDSLCVDATKQIIYDTDVETISNCQGPDQLNLSWTSNFDVQYDIFRIAPTFALIANNSTQATWNNLSAGTYIVKWENDNRTICEFSRDTVVISDFSLSSIDLSVQDIDCFNANNGLITASIVSNVGGPFTYQWSSSQSGPLANTPTIDNLPPGTYAVTITDRTGCMITSDTTLTSPPKMDVVASINNVSCASTSDGAVQLTVVGGVPSYAYQWSSGQTTSTLTGLTTGAYAVSITDTNGCSSDVSLMVGTQNCSPCDLGASGLLDICAEIAADPNHSLATMDCDNGGTDNQTECNNNADPNDPKDDASCPVNFCVDAILGNLDICATLNNDPTHELSTLDCDGDGVLNAAECTGQTNPVDPCDFVDTSITDPITADQSDCENLCPDLTPITTILPGNIAGGSVVNVAVELTELNGFDTDGSGILVRMPSDPRLAFVWDPFLTSIALIPVNNSDWNYLGDNGVVHTFQYVGNGTVIAGSSTTAFGFTSIYDPQNTDGQTTITASLVPFSGGECFVLNNSDSERLVYFQ